MGDSFRVLALLALMAAAETAFGDDSAPLKPGSKVLSAPNGRYQFGQISDYRKDQYMLDTQTGRLWVIKSVTRGSDSPGAEGDLILDPIPYEGLTDTNRTVTPH